MDWHKKKHRNVRKQREFVQRTCFTEVNSNIAHSLSLPLHHNENVGLTLELAVSGFPLGALLSSVGLGSAQDLGQRRPRALTCRRARDVETSAPLPGSLRAGGGMAPLRLMVLRLGTHFHQGVPCPGQSRGHGAHHRERKKEREKLVWKRHWSAGTTLLEKLSKLGVIFRRKRPAGAVGYARARVLVAAWTGTGSGRGAGHARTCLQTGHVRESFRVEPTRRPPRGKHSQHQAASASRCHADIRLHIAGARTAAAELGEEGKASGTRKKKAKSSVLFFLSTRAKFHTQSQCLVISVSFNSEELGCAEKLLFRELGLDCFDEDVWNYD